SELLPAAGGRRVIELDVMDPSVMRWSAPSAPPPPPASPDPPRRPPGRRPSPRPRPRPLVEDETPTPTVPIEMEIMAEWPPRAPAAATDFLAPEAPEVAEPELPPEPVPEPELPPEPDLPPPPVADDEPFDQEAGARPTVTVPVGDPLDDPTVAAAYM